MSEAAYTPGERGVPTIWWLVAAHRVFVAIVVLVFTAAATAVAFVSAPVYRTSVIVLPAESKTSAAGLSAALGGLSSLGSVVGLGIGQSQDTVEAVALLESRDFAEAFIRDYNLTPLLFADRWDAAHSTWNLKWWQSEPTLYDAYKKFDRKVRHVIEDKKTGLVTLEVDWTDSAAGAKWANEMIRRVNEAMRQRALTESDSSITVLMSELKAAPTVELQGAIARTIETYVKSRVLAKVRPEYAFRVIDPAKPPGRKDFIKPNRPLYISCGFLGGFVIAALLLLGWEMLRQQRPRELLEGELRTHASAR